LTFAVFAASSANIEDAGVDIDNNDGDGMQVVLRLRSSYS
jgi:hypothetical protein